MRERSPSTLIRSSSSAKPSLLATTTARAVAFSLSMGKKPSHASGQSEARKPAVDERLCTASGGLTDLGELWERIAIDSIEAADPFFRRRGLRHLSRPRARSTSRHRRTDLTSRPLRFISRRNYLIAYAPDEKPLVVIAVLHGRRNPNVLAAVLRGRQ